MKIDYKNFIGGIFNLLCGGYIFYIAYDCYLHQTLETSSIHVMFICAAYLLLMGVYYTFRSLKGTGKL